MKTITSKAAQTRIANNIKKQLEEELSIYKREQGKYVVEIEDGEICKNIYFYFKNKYTNMITSSAMETAIEVLKQYSAYEDDVTYSIETRPKTYYNNYEKAVEWITVPVFNICVNRKH